MERTRLRVDGIYNSELIGRLNDLRVSEFVFDFRPKSFNFIQIHCFLTILDEAHRVGNKYFLKFSHEKDYIISKILSDLKSYISQKGQGNIALSDFYLEFDDKQEVSFYEQFDMPYLWHFQEGVDLSQVVNSKNLIGVVLNYSFIQFKHNASVFDQFIIEFGNIFFKRKDLILGLERSWNDDIFPTLEHYLKFDFITLPLDYSVEASYRNIDFHKLKTQLNSLSHT